MPACADISDCLQHDQVQAVATDGCAGVFHHSPGKVIECIG